MQLEIETENEAEDMEEPMDLEDRLACILRDVLELAVLIEAQEDLEDRLACILRDGVLSVLSVADEDDEPA